MGSVAAIDLADHKTTLTGLWSSLRGVAWSPSGQEVWYTALGGAGNRALRAVDLSGSERVLLSGLTDMLLLDVSPEGRVLLARETTLRQVEAMVAGRDRPADLSLARAGSFGHYMSDDGEWVLALTPDAVPRILIHPTGPGESRELPNPDGITADSARWLPGGKIVVLGSTAAQVSRG